MGTLVIPSPRATPLSSITEEDEVDAEGQDQQDQQPTKHANHTTTNQTTGAPRGKNLNNKDAMGDLWENKALQLCERELGEIKYDKRIRKCSQLHTPSLGSKTRLSLQANRAKKSVANTNSAIRRCNAVGAVGYAVVLKDTRMPENDFFKPGRRFRIRLRHSNLRCDDDAAACVREAAIKFADQNEDGPLDLIFFTGRTAPARNCKTFMDIIKLKKPDELRAMCFKDPNFYYSLADGLRRAPDSFADMIYHSHVVYKFVPSDDKPRLVKFRLIPAECCRESGKLDESDQARVWDTSRRLTDTNTLYYLRNEYMQRLEVDEPIKYILQAQLATDPDDDSLWNPQKIWDEHRHPWFDLIKIKLTTALTCIALHRTYFNIVDKPPCLKFPPPVSVHDYKSYHYVYCQMYTKFEIKHLGASVWKEERARLDYSEGEKIKHHVTISTEPVKEGRPRVDVFITLTGTQGRTTPKRLDRRLEDIEDEQGVRIARPRLASQRDDPDAEHFEVLTEPIGELVSVIIAVRHRHLTDDWYLRYVTVTDTEREVVRHFPCHSVVLAKITLRPGEVSLPQLDCHEVLRQERLLELRDRQLDYLWSPTPNLPSHLLMKSPDIKHLPVNEQLRAEKYVGMQWEVDPAMSDILLAFLQARNQAAMPMVPAFQRQSSYHGDMPSMSMTTRTAMRRASYMRQQSMPACLKQNAQKPRPVNLKARLRWKKVKLAISFIHFMKLPDGPKGDMCKAIQDDVDFGRYFLMGTNPAMFHQINHIPANFPVTDEIVESSLDRGMNLEQEIDAGHIYLADYSILQDIPTYHQDADHRYMGAPLCMLYVRASGDVIAIAIQLNQEPGPDNPIFSSRGRPEDWVLAKLWVRCADFQYQFVITHILKCHFVIEPFALATLRHLSGSHPIYKLLKPHFRYTLPTNTLLRRNILKKGGAADKYMSIGSEGFRCLMSKYYRDYFCFDQLSLPHDLRTRGVDNRDTLPNYFYRDDGLSLWNAISKYCHDMIANFYKTEEDVTRDTEIQAWIRDIHEHGFPGLREEQRSGLPTSFSSSSELAEVTTKILFTTTCQHSATHSEALDMYGFLPLVPAMMRQPPPTKKNTVSRELIVKSLPDQSPEAYYGSLANIMQFHKPEENPLGNNVEMYFVEPEARKIKGDFKKKLDHIGMVIKARNSTVSILYENLIPSWIPNSVEPVPFFPPNSIGEDCSIPLTGSRYGQYGGMGGLTPSVPLMTLPLCMSFARNIGGRSFMGRRLSVNMFSRAMGNVGTMGHVNVPMNSIDRKRLSLTRMQVNSTRMSTSRMSMAMGMY